MSVRTLMIASAALAVAAVAAAEPPKPEARPAAQQPSRPVEVVLASAEQVQAPEAAAPQGQAPAPVKRPRAARVTTCRCGDQTAQR